MVGRGWTGEEVAEVWWIARGEALEDCLGKMKVSSGRECTKSKVPTSGSSRGAFASMENGTATKVKQQFQAISIRL